MAYDSEDAYSSSASSSSSASRSRGTARGLLAAGSGLSSSSNSMLSSAQGQAAANSDRQTPMYHKGGRVRKTGVARLLKGEVVIPRSKAAEGRKLLKSRKKTSRPGRKMGGR